MFFLLFLCVCVFFLLLFCFLFLCVLLFITYVVLSLSSFISPSFFFFSRVFRLIALVVVVFVLIPPLFHLVFFLLPRHPRALEKENNGTHLIFFVCLSGIFAKVSFHGIIVSLFFWWISFIHRMFFVSCSWTMF